MPFSQIRFKIYRFQNLPFSNLPFSKSTVFKIYRFQNLPFSISTVFKIYRLLSTANESQGGTFKFRRGSPSHWKVKSARRLGTERNGTIAYCSTFRIACFIGPLFRTEQSYSKRSHLIATSERCTFRNGTIWNGAISFLCEWGLSSPITNGPIL